MIFLAQLRDSFQRNRLQLIIIGVFDGTVPTADETNNSDCSLLSVLEMQSELFVDADNWDLQSAQVVKLVLQTLLQMCKSETAALDILQGVRVDGNWSTVTNKFQEYDMRPGEFSELYNYMGESRGLIGYIDEILNSHVNRDD